MGSCGEHKMRLNIIGNGFDLYHGLPCSYYYFGCFLAKYYPDFYAEMSQMFGFSCYRCVGYEEVETIVDNIFWRTFEERLGKLDSTWMEDSLMDDLELECDDPVDIEIPEVTNAERIKKKFCDWIRTTVNTEENYRIVKSRIKRKKCKFSAEDYFINFNYTQTLQEVYKILNSRVYHIHGQCAFDEEECNLIVGHGNVDAIRDLEKKIGEIESETYYLADQRVRNRLNEYKCERSILRDLRKNVESLLHDLNFKLDYKRLDVEEIWVWGLSCGDVDKPYIEFLRDRYPDVKWKFSYYDENEKSERERYAAEIGLDESQVDYFELNNPNSVNILEEIVLENDIEEF